MSYFILLIISLLIPSISALQCYKCGCFVIPGQTTCTTDSELNCVIQYVENSYCSILRTPGEIEFGHSPNAALIYLESLHYIRATEEFRYSESTSSWLAPRVTQVSYGCDWNLCNSPRILDLLPNGLSFSVDTSLLSSLLVPGASETLSSCLACSQCKNSSASISCPSTACNGTCFIDDHIDDPQYNTDGCSIAFESLCDAQKRDVTVHVTGNYYIDDRLSDVTEIDIYCRKSDCNSYTTGQMIQKNVTYSTNFNNQLYFRPLPGTTPPTTGDELLACYVCDCQHLIGDGACQLLNCTIEYKTQSYCEIVRDFKDRPAYELISLSHVPRDVQRYPHYIRAEEEIILYTNLTWHPPSVSLISYVCDWPLCNDPRIVNKLDSSYQFNAEPSDIGTFLLGSQPLQTCLDCSICSNTIDEANNCTSKPCSSTGRCFIEQYVDDPQFDDCEYAFIADCEDGATYSSIIIAATYSIDDDKLDIDEVDVYCSLNNCNSPTTVSRLIDLIEEDIRLDPTFFFRPAQNSTTTTTSMATATGPVTTSSVVSTTKNSGFIAAAVNSQILLFSLILSH